MEIHMVRKNGYRLSLTTNVKRVREDYAQANGRGGTLRGKGISL